MRESDDKSGYTTIDHITFDIIIPLLSTSAQSVFLRIYRQTIGWKQPVDKIANSQFRAKCRIKANKTVESAIKELKGLKLITVEGETTKIKEFGLNFETLEAYGVNHIKCLDEIKEKLST